MSLSQRPQHHLRIGLGLGPSPPEDVTNGEHTSHAINTCHENRHVDLDPGIPKHVTNVSHIRHVLHAKRITRHTRGLCG